MSKKPSWYFSRWRGKYNWKTHKWEVKHETPLRCPYCGSKMSFKVFSSYQAHSSDWYWLCPLCFLRLPNKADFNEEELTKARKKWRKKLKEKIKKLEAELSLYLKLYKCYGKYFTPEEKRDRLIETIEENS